MRGCNNCFIKFLYTLDSCPHCGSKNIEDFNKYDFLSKAFKKAKKEILKIIRKEVKK